MKIITTNRKARFEYEILQAFEAGISLTGTEVKSLRAGHVTLNEAYCRVTANHQVSLRNMHINVYDFGNRNNHEPLRDRPLLLHKNEIRRLHGQLKNQGITLIPLKLYFKGGLVKVEIALVRGKKLYDKRESMKQRDAEREIQRNLKP